MRTEKKKGRWETVKKKQRRSSSGSRRSDPREPRYENKKFRILDPLSILISIAVAVLTATLAALSNARGFDRTWYGDILTTAVGVVFVFATLNLFYLFRAGIRVEGGVCYLGVDAEKQPIAFECKELVRVRLTDGEGGVYESGKRNFFGAQMEFCLRDGRALAYRANWITARSYRAICRYFKLTEEE